MTTEISGKAALQKRLTSLLLVGDDDADYVIDVLDQLLEIGDDVDDVASYLMSFLGDDDADGNVMQFAADVKRYKLGEEIIVNVEPSPPEPNAITGEKLRQGNDTAQHHQQQQQKESLHQKITSKNINNKISVPDGDTATKPPVKADEKPQSAKTDGGKRVTQVSKASSSTSKPVLPKVKQTRATTIEVLPIRKLEKGKPKIICGCYGTKHPPLTNCLHCGRISCEAEGYDFCPFCNIQIQDFSQRMSSSSSSAVLHKERLLEFDRTSAARTHILDDQEDYYASSTSMWNTHEEQENAKEKEEARQQLLHQRQKQKIMINF